MNALEKYNLIVDEDTLKNDLDQLKKAAHESKDSSLYAKMLNLIDLTTLTEIDNEEKIVDMCTKVNAFEENFADLPNVAAICVYPSMVKYVKKHLKEDNINIASVGGGFPASQTFIEIKTEECKRAVEEGADEIDIVIPVGEFLAGKEDLVFQETKAIKEAIGDAHLKVILETGDLTPEQIRKTSLLAMEGGADFIKTSTGKVEVSATHEAMHIMCTAIKDYYDKTGRMVGIKPAGGIREADDALVYYHIVGSILGDKWLNNKWFRFGASSLANSLLQVIREDNKLKFF